MNNHQKKSKVILVAEDDEDHFLLTKDAFEKLGAATELINVRDGDELLDFLKTSPQVDIILLDLNMPRKDGREVLKEIKSHRELRRIPVVVFTTSMAEEDVLLCYELGANSFLRKPLGFDQWVNLAKSFDQYWFQTVELPGGCTYEARH